MLATHMGPGQPQMMAQAIRQREARLDIDVDILFVDLELHPHAGTHIRRAAVSWTSTSSCAAPNIKSRSVPTIGVTDGSTMLPLAKI
jgi:hypothetical protein